MCQDGLRNADNIVVSLSRDGRGGAIAASAPLLAPAALAAQETAGGRGLCVRVGVRACASVDHYPGYICGYVGGVRLCNNNTFKH